MRIASGTTGVGDCTGGGVDVEVGTSVDVPVVVPDPQALNRVAINRIRRINFARTSLLRRKDYLNYTLRRSMLNANLPPMWREVYPITDEVIWIRF